MAIYQWGASPCHCIDGSGVLTLPEGGALALDPNPARSGAIRLPNGASVRARNGDDSEDLDALTADDNDNLLLGGPLEATHRVNNVVLGASLSVAMSVDGANRLAVEPARVTLEVPDVLFARAVESPTITQEGNPGAVQQLTIKAQDRVAGSGAGGDLVLRCASGTSSGGAVEIGDASGGSIMRATDSAVTMANSVPFVNFANATWKKLLSSQTRTSTNSPTLLGDLSFALGPGNYTFRIHLIVETPTASNGGLRVGGAITSGVAPSSVSRVATIVHLNTTSSSFATCGHSVNMTGHFIHLGTTSARYLFVAEGGFALSAASVYEVRVAQHTPAGGATTYLGGSYAMFNKCSN
jgi:hypothetical protein